MLKSSMYSQLSGTQASVLYSESVLYSGVRVISSPTHVVILVLMLFDIKPSKDII